MMVANKKSDALDFIDCYKGYWFYKNNNLSSSEISCIGLRWVENDEWLSRWAYISSKCMADSAVNWHDVCIQLVMDDLRDND